VNSVDISGSSQAKAQWPEDAMMQEKGKGKEKGKGCVDEDAMMQEKGKGKEDAKGKHKGKGNCKGKSKGKDKGNGKGESYVCDCFGVCTCQWEISSSSGDVKGNGMNWNGKGKSYVCDCSKGKDKGNGKGESYVCDCFGVCTCQWDISSSSGDVKGNGMNWNGKGKSYVCDCFGVCSRYLPDDVLVRRLHADRHWSRLRTNF
jgi:hypothetical protein